MKGIARQIAARVGGLAKKATTSTVAPTVTNDSASGFALHDTWVDTVTGLAYICTKAAVGVAVWTQIGAVLSVSSVSVDPAVTIDQGTTYARAT